MSSGSYKASNSWHILDFYSAVAGAKKLYFCLWTSLLIVYNNFIFIFEILFYFLFIHIATRIFARPRQAVPYIVNMDRNFVLFCWGLPLCKFWNRSCVSITSCGTK